MKKNIHIEIVRSSTGRLTSMNKKSCDMIVSVLRRNYARVGVTIVNDSSDLHKLIAKRPDLVFLGAKYVPDSSIASEQPPEILWLSEYLDEHGLNHTGSTVEAIKLDDSKPMAKQVVNEAGLKTARFFVASQGEYTSNDQIPLNFPLFMKPADLGGGIGINKDSVVRDFDAFDKKSQSISNDLRADTLVEEYLAGREFSIAIFESNDSNDLLASPVEIIAEQNDLGDRILGQDAKNEDLEQVIAVPDGAIKKVVTELAMSVFRALGARDYGRIDIRLDADNVPYFLEANLIPGLGNGYFARACMINLRMSYEDMICKIIELALCRSVPIERLLLGAGDYSDTSFVMPEARIESA